MCPGWIAATALGRRKALIQGSRDFPVISLYAQLCGASTPAKPYTATRLFAILNPENVPKLVARWKNVGTDGGGTRKPTFHPHPNLLPPMEKELGCYFPTSRGGIRFWLDLFAPFPLSEIPRTPAYPA